MRPDYSDIIRRLEEANGPDRELDLTIARTVVPDVIVMRQRDDDTGSDPFTYWEYTASLDSAIALVERMLPGWGRTSGKTPDGMAMAALRRPTPRGLFPCYNCDRLDGHEALALLSALFRALASEEKQP